MSSIVTQLQKDLLQARKNRDVLTVETLQAALTRITNAEAVNPANAGEGVTEVPRKVLSHDEVQAILRDELTEIAEAHKSMAGHHDEPYAIDLANKITILSGYIH